MASPRVGDQGDNETAGQVEIVRHGAGEGEGGHRPLEGERRDRCRSASGPPCLRSRGCRRSSGRAGRPSHPAEAAPRACPGPSRPRGSPRAAARSAPRRCARGHQEPASACLRWRRAPARSRASRCRDGRSGLALVRSGLVREPSGSAPRRRRSKGGHRLGALRRETPASAAAEGRGRHGESFERGGPLRAAVGRAASDKRARNACRVRASLAGVGDLGDRACRDRRGRGALGWQADRDGRAGAPILSS